MRKRGERVSGEEKKREIVNGEEGGGGGEGAIRGREGLVKEAGRDKEGMRQWERLWAEMKAQSHTRAAFNAPGEARGQTLAAPSASAPTLQTATSEMENHH